MDRPAQRPEGALIERALKASRLSQREAARRAGLSENRWRAIMHGYQNVGAGTNAPVRGPADTVARMAQVVGVTPEQLEGAERPDAADELRALKTDKPEPTTGEGLSDVEVAELLRLAREDPQVARATLRKMQGGGRTPPPTPDEDRQEDTA